MERKIARTLASWRHGALSQGFTRWRGLLVQARREAELLVLRTEQVRVTPPSPARVASWPVCCAWPVSLAAAMPCEMVLRSALLLLFFVLAQEAKAQLRFEAAEQEKAAACQVDAQRRKLAVERALRRKLVTWTMGLQRTSFRAWRGMLLQARRDAEVAAHEAAEQRARQELDAVLARLEMHQDRKRL